MHTLSALRRYELVFVVSLVVAYVIRRLLEEVQRLDSMIGLGATGNGIEAGAFWRILDGRYDHTLHNNVPLIVGAIFILAAWYVFHNLAYPALQNRFDDQRGGQLIGLTLLLLLIGTFVYHYLKQYVRYQYTDAEDIIGLRVERLYRKRTVLADAIGFLVLLTAYELAFQYYQFLTRRVGQESKTRFRLVSYLLLGGLAFFAFALNGYLPPTLWSGQFRAILIRLSVGVQVFLLQQYVYSYILPVARLLPSSETVLFNRVMLFVLALLLTTTALWGAATNFYFNPRISLLSWSIVVLISSVAIAFGRQALNREETVLQTQVSTKSAELASLRAQINPHFLFNALNSLYATALREKGEKTAEGIQKLGDMMRFMLQENNHDRIPLDKEVEYLHNYIQIQRMRIDETHPIEIRVNIQEPSREIYLAPMLLTPFVENAFKHGISLRNPSWIYITLTLDATKLYFKVHNSRHPRSVEAAEHHDPERFQAGVGLDNVRKRLELIYPDRYTLDIQQSEQDYFVSLTLAYW